MKIEIIFLFANKKPDRPDRVFYSFNTNGDR